MTPSSSASAQSSYSLHGDLSQCKMLLERLRTCAYYNGRPLPPHVEQALIHLENTLKFCLPVCSGGSASKMYPCILDVLTSMNRSTHYALLKSYFNNAPLWQRYQQCVLDTMTTLWTLCHNTNVKPSQAKQCDQKCSETKTACTRTTDTVSTVQPFKRRFSPSQMVLKLKEFARKY